MFIIDHFNRLNFKPVKQKIVKKPQRFCGSAHGSHCFQHTVHGKARQLIARAYTYTQPRRQLPKLK